MKFSPRPSALAWSLTAIVLGWPVPVPAQPEGPRPGAARSETAELPGGRHLKGRLVGDAASGFRFEAERGSEAIPLERASAVVFEGPEPVATAGLPPFQVLIGPGQRLSGRLEAADDATVRIDPGPGRRPVAVSRGGAQALIQRPGEAQVLAEGFEALEEARWAQLGEPEIVEEPHLAGRKSLRIEAGGTSVTHRLAEPIGSGRLEIAFFDRGARVADQRWFVDLTFRGEAGPAPIRAVLGWDDEGLGVQSPDGPSLAVQRLPRRPGWHRLVVRFGPDRTELSVDGDELAVGKGPTGPLSEIRLASQTLGKADPPEGLAGYVDDLRLSRLAEPPSKLEIDPTQDEVRLVGGDQLYGRFRSADPERVALLVDGRETTLTWSDVAGVYFRRAPIQGVPVEGLLVRLEWRAGAAGDPRDADRIEGALVSATPSALTVATPYAGEVEVPRALARRMEILGRGRRLVLDAMAHHLGNNVFERDVKLDPPQPEGGVLEVPFDLDRVPEGASALVVDVLQVAGEADGLPFAAQVAKGELRTNVALDGKPLDYLNRHVTSRNETPERIRLPIPAGRLHPGRNVLRFEQVGTAMEPGNLDDLGILSIAIESDPVPAAEKERPRP